LEKLGFPWILSSESRLINGLCGILGEENFSALFRGVQSARNGSLRSTAFGWAGFAHGTSLPIFLILCKIDWALIALVVVSQRGSNVMAGLVPAIHEARLQKDLHESALCT
jgi:hypothetical protein